MSRKNIKSGKNVLRGPRTASFACCHSLWMMQVKNFATLLA